MPCGVGNAPAFIDSCFIPKTSTFQFKMHVRRRVC